MDIPSKHVFETLMENGVDELHHANSVATSCQFIRSRSLMSRGTIERLGLYQTDQSSDDMDKRYSIWFDVFADSVDIHARAKRAIVYGPVLFVIDSEIVMNSYTGRLWVTKCNPMYWVGKSNDERWFRSKADLATNFVRGDFGQMVVFRHCGGELPFKRFLKKIVLDDPKLQTEDGVNFYSMAIGALRLALQDANIDIPIEKRACPRRCQCVNYWAEDDDRLFKMFDPKI